MSKTLIAFLDDARDFGIIDHSNQYAREAIALMTSLRELKFPNAVLRTVHTQVVYRLRQADALGFQRPNVPFTSEAAMGIPIGMTLGYHPIIDVAEEVKDLVKAVLNHVVAIARGLGRSDENVALKEAVAKLGKEFHVPDDIVANYLAEMSGYRNAFGAGEPGSGIPFPMSPRAPGASDRFSRSDATEPGTLMSMSGDDANDKEDRSRV